MDKAKHNNSTKKRHICYQRLLHSFARKTSLPRIYNNDEGKRKLTKEEGYNNLKMLMETNKIILLDDDEVKASLKAIQAEHEKDTGKLKIWGDDSHIAEGLWRACWCSKDKTLNIYYYQD